MGWLALNFFSSSEPKAHWWAYRLGRPPSLSETTGPISHIFFHMELLWDGWMKVCSTGPGHVTKAAAMTIYGKKLKRSSLEPKCRWPWNLVCSIGCSSTVKFVQMRTLSWYWPILWQGQIWSLMLLYGKKMLKTRAVRRSDYSPTIALSEEKDKLV